MYAVTTASCHRRDISDRAGELVAPHRPGGPGKIGRPAQDNRRFTNAVFWTLRTGDPVRDLPSDYGDDGAGGSCTGCVIWWRTDLRGSRNGAEQRCGTPKSGIVSGDLPNTGVIPLGQDNMATRPSPVVNRPRF